MLTVGTEIERYRIEAVLGRGGAGTVYAVRHQTLGTLHALKVLHIGSPTMRARFLEEGRIQARLRHPNLVPVSDVLDLMGHPGLLMDHVGGGSLAERLQRDPMGLLRGLQWSRDVAEGMAHAHGLGITHRDLKPANVLLTVSEGRERPVGRVTDFGLARVLGDQQSLTQMGAMLGTPAYMAPEQVQDARGVDARADIFSLGVMLYELFTGERPFQGPSHAVIFAQAREAAFPPLDARAPDLPAPLRELITACLQPARGDRPQRCEEVAAVLRAVEVEAQGADRILWTPSEDAATPPTGGSGGAGSVPVVEPPTTLASFFAPEDSPWTPTPRAPGGPDAPEPSATEVAPALASASTQADSAAEEAPRPQADAPAAAVPAAAPDRRPRLPRRAVALLVPLVAAALGLGEALEARLSWWLLQTFAPPIEARDVGLVAVSEDDPFVLRPDYPQLLRDLRDAGVRGVVFDLALTRPSPYDGSIAAAMVELERDGVPVVVPLRFTEEGPEPPASRAIQDAARLGHPEWVRSSAAGQVHKLGVRRTLEDGGSVWHLAVQGAALASGAGADGIRLEGDALVVGPHRVSAPGRELWLTPTLPPPYVPHDAPERFHALEGRVAFIGAHGRNRDEFRTPAGIRYGVEMIATLSQAIVADRVSHRLGALWDLLAAVLAGIGGLALERWRPRAGWAFAALALVGGAAVVTTGHLLALLPLGLAGALGAWAGATR